MTINKEKFKEVMLRSINLAEEKRDYYLMLVKFTKHSKKLNQHKENVKLYGEIIKDMKEDYEEFINN